MTRPSINRIIRNLVRNGWKHEDIHGLLQLAFTAEEIDKLIQRAEATREKSR